MLPGWTGMSGMVWLARAIWVADSTVIGISGVNPYW